MKFLRQGVCLALLGAGLAAVPSTLAEASAPAAPQDSLVQQIKNGADGTVTTRRESATGKVGFIRASGAGADLMPGADAGSAAGAGAKADAFLAKYGAVFGAGSGELVRSRISSSEVGWNVTYVQRYRGVDVFGAMIRAQVDREGNLTSVNGYAAPDLKLSVSPRLTAAEAGRAAVAAVRADPPGHDGDADVTGIKAASSKLAVYRTGVPRGDLGKPVLVYVVDVSNRANVRDRVFVDAASGKLVNRYSLIHDALHRELYEGSPDPGDLVWEEGDPIDPLTDEQENLVLGTGESYWFFMNAFGRDSFDDDGGTMQTVNNDPTISCPNANWNGATTNYCNGVTSDDVVAHEWGHAYTEYTWDGIYQWQPGALNESYSDIWGETIDLINGRMDGDEGDINTPRPVGQCSKYTRGAIEMTINSPPSAAGPCTAAAAAFGPVFDQTGVTTDIVVGQDSADSGSTTDGCNALTNAGAVAGKFVYVDRGGCTFQVKADVADAAGATGIVVGDNVAGRPPISMSGNADIYGVMVTLEDGARIKSAGTVNATIRDAGTEPEADSYRWLMGEDSFAFGGAIRDMWNPNCYGDPGKVSDAQYHCSTDDVGGVHSNSGVPNHAYALLVDGGTFNGRAITPIGMTRAAHIYWRAQTEYQTPTTDFVDHADALEASCADLVGETVGGLGTDGAPENDYSPPALPDATITAADCTQVSNAIAAVELRKDPVQCNFQPLLKPGGPSLCGPGTATKTLYKEAFEDGLAGWDTASQVVYPGASSTPWEADASAPGNHPGGVAKAPDPSAGECSGSPADLSSSDSLISPVITMPDKTKAPKLTFDHYIATEHGYDGGNVKVSINEGAFKVIPAAAFLFNPYNDTLETAPAGNTNPLAGQPAFTGTDGGEVLGTWGTSFVNLAALGAKSGDKLRIRFDFGRDGCGGLDGWYVDNVTVTDCDKTGKLASTTTMRVRPKSPDFRENFRVKVRVWAEGEKASGKVRLYADGDRIGRGKLEDGKIVFRVARNLKPGKYKLVAKYVGTDNVAASKDKARMWIGR